MKSHLKSLGRRLNGSKDTFRGLVDHLGCVHDMESFDKEFVGVTLIFYVPSLFVTEQK